MFIFFKIFIEGIVLAFRELWFNKLRTFLSLLGITIGIFCVISVLSVIDSFKNNLESSFSRLGDDVVYVSRESWEGDPGKNWWKYVKRPYPSFEEFKVIKDKVKTAEAVTIRSFIGGKKLKYRNNVVENINTVAASHDFSQIFDLNLEQGRYFTPEESYVGTNGIILGNKTAEALFPNISYPVGKTVKILGRKVKVIGILKAEGQSLLGDGFDEAAIIPYNFLRKFEDAGNRRYMPLIAVKAAENVPIEMLKDELTGVLRAKRQLKPREANDFELNQLSILTRILDALFGVVFIAGFVIGFFAILVGGFGIANIMFVSVKERTRLIGIKKSLGAQRVHILFEFLTEAVMLTLIGGVLGIGFVYIALTVGSGFVESLEFSMSYNNMVWGLVISIIIGLISGISPAISASKLDPVVAMRS